MRYNLRELTDKTGITTAQFWRWRTKGLIPPAIIPNGFKASAYYTDEHEQRIKTIIDTLVDGRVTIADLRERFYLEEHPEALDDGDLFP
jgi:DNA-binding transcriptional MerR regulator